MAESEEKLFSPRLISIALNLALSSFSFVVVAFVRTAKSKNKKRMRQKIYVSRPIIKIVVGTGGKAEGRRYAFYVLLLRQEKEKKAYVYGQQLCEHVFVASTCYLYLISNERRHLSVEKKRRKKEGRKKARHLICQIMKEEEEKKKKKEKEKEKQCGGVISVVSLFGTEQ